MPGKISPLLENMVRAATDRVSLKVITSVKDIRRIENSKIIFALELNNAGFNIGMMEIVSALYEMSDVPLSGCLGSILVHSPCQLYTKSAAQNLILLANALGCEFMGHPVVEAAGNLENLNTWRKTMKLSNEEICLELSKKLGYRLMEYSPKQIVNPNILVLHSSLRKTSNTLELWHMVSGHLGLCTINEQHVENGEVLDCKGCSYKTCVHFGMQNSCFYGGVMVKNILPAIQKADAVVWVCPNYNDAVSANLTAVINRLTALYRTTSFYNKTMFSVIVSANSGSDSVAKQLIGALNINKGFRLPPHFDISAIANDTGDIGKVPGIREKAQSFAEDMMKNIKA
jgi:hypothetical protein